MEQIILKTYNSRTEAELDKGFLDTKGIKSYIIADDGGGSNPYLLNATGFVKLMVVKKHYKQACQILKIKLLPWKQN